MATASNLKRREFHGWLDLSISYKGACVIAIPVLCLVLQSIWLYRLHREEESAAQWTQHTREVELEAQRLLGALVDAETADRGYVITQDPAFLEPYHAAEQTIPEATTKLEFLVRDNPTQTARMREIDGLAQEKLQIVGSVYALVQGANGAGPQNTEQVQKGMRQGKSTMDALRRRIADFLNEEKRLLGERSARLERQRNSTNTVIWGGFGFGLGGGLLAGYLFSLGISRRLAVIQRNAELLAQELPLSTPCGGRDEIGRLEHELYRTSTLVAERTAQVRASAEQLRQRGEELERANAELEAFSYSVSHDLRSPLRHIDGYSNILLEDFGPNLPAEAQSLLRRIRNSTEKMGHLIDELLNLGRIGRKPLRLEITGLSSLVEEVRAELQAEAAGRQVEWQMEKLPFLECDAGLMKQVFSNLLSNALKYTRPRTPAVITIGQTTAQGAQAIFVRDNGVGFNMQYAEKLFGVFQRLHRAEDFEGTGIGLATVARIVQKHGGRIWAEAELDRGATFYFTVNARAAVNGASALENGAKGEDTYVHERS